MSRVAVLKGGRSLERQVSLKSGARVEEALGRLGHDVVSVDVGGDLVERLLAERPEVAFIALHGRDGERRGALGDLLGKLGGTDEGRATDHVPRLEVVEVLLAGDRFDDREGARGPVLVEDRHREVAARHVALEQHLAVVGERGQQRAGHVLGRARELDPQRRVLARGLDDDREAQALFDRRKRDGGSQLPEGRLVEGVEIRRRDTVIAHRVLCEHLVCRPDAG